MFDPKITEMLNEPLDPKYVKSRDKGGTKLSYIEGWHAIAEANRVFGFGNWDRELTQLTCITTPGTKNTKGNFVVGYTATVRISVESLDVNGVRQQVFRDGTGYGSGFAKSEGDAHESAVKEAETDAMKRAFMTFGNIFGLALYDKLQANVSKPTARALPQNEAAAQVILEKLVECTTVEQINELRDSVRPQIQEIAVKDPGFAQMQRANFDTHTAKLEAEAESK
jgi:DNA repair and recombination protein RAD52